MIGTFINVTEALIISYFIALNSIYLVFTVMAFFHLLNYRNRLWRGALRSMLSESAYRPITLLVPAFNERETLIATIRSLLTLRYPEFEIVVVNDGSTDDTLELVRRAFNLYPVPTATRVLVPVWCRGGRCSLRLAEEIAARLAVVQARNLKARQSHRKATIKRLHEMGIRLRDLRICRWSEK